MKNIRNFSIIAHIDHGKSTLSDRLIQEVDLVSDRDFQNQILDTMDIERERGISVTTSVMKFNYRDFEINLLDTPGFLDFTGDALAAVRVADAAIIVVGATSGVEVGTEVVWKYCEDRGIPRMFFVSMMDKEHADFEKVFQEIKERLQGFDVKLTKFEKKTIDGRLTVTSVGGDW